MTYQRIIAKKLNIGVFFGSRSPEHDVSIITGQAVISVLKESKKYNVIPVYIDRKGKWRISEKLKDIKFFQKPDFEKELEKLPEFLIDLDSSKEALKFISKKRSIFRSAKSIIIDIAFPALHGSFGEDGSIQGLFEMLNVPYVGCNVEASALAMNKIISRKIFEREGFLTVNNLYFNKYDFNERKEEILREIENKLAYPLFVKPNRLGSSIGISKVADKKELEFAIEVVFQFDKEVIIEEAVRNLIEVNCAVIGSNELIASLPEQPLYKQEFQTFEEKYLTKGGTIKKGGKKNIIPAPLPKEKLKEIQDLSKKAYKTLGCSGISRIDFLVDAEAMKIYINEINTMPGTLQFHLWEASGISRREIVEKLINCAVEQFNNRKKLLYTFNSFLIK